MEQILISLVSGVVGGNIAGALMKENSLGPVWNSVVGLLGGGLGGQLLGLLGMDGAGLFANIGGSAVGGAILLFIVGLIKKSTSKKG